MTTFKRIFFLILLIIFGLIGIKALFHQGFYTSHDGEHQVLRLNYFHQALLDGQFPPRWAGLADNGYGYPLFVFSYQSPWFLGLPLISVGFSLTDSIKILFIIGYILSGLVMYLWIKEMLSQKAGFIAAFLYMWAPYRFLNIFVRGSLGESLVYLFLPLIFWGIWKIGNNKNILLGILLTAVGISGLILSHLIMLIVFSFPIFLWTFFIIIKSKNRFLTAKKILTSIILGLGLSSYYLLPAIIEKKFTVANQLLRSHFQEHFVTINQLIYSKWGYGFDFQNTIRDEMSFQIGIVQWLVILFLLLIFMVGLIKNKKIDFNAFFILIIFLFSVIMMLSISFPIWDIVVKFTYFDFPWRFLGVAIFAGSLASAYLVYKIPKLSLIIIFCIIIIALYTNRNHLNVNQYTYFDDKYYKSLFNTTNSYNEYRPRSADDQYIKQKRDRFEENKKELIIEKYISKSNLLAVDGEVINVKNSTARININYYPGWNIILNNSKQNLSTPQGVMEVTIPKGKFSLQIRFTDTPTRKLSSLLTIVSIGFLIYIIYFILKVKPNHNKVT